MHCRLHLSLVLALLPSAALAQLSSDSAQGAAFACGASRNQGHTIERGRKRRAPR